MIECRQMRFRELKKSLIDNVVTDPSITDSQRYNTLTQLYYNQNGNDSNQQYVMDSYLRLMRANNSNARATGSTQAQNNSLYSFDKSYGRPKL